MSILESVRFKIETKNMATSPRKRDAAFKDDGPPPPASPNFRYSGYLSKLGEGRAAWKKRFMHIDATTGWLYWWNKPDGKVLGAISLADTVLTELPAPEFCFRLSRPNGKFRDLRADTEAGLGSWVRHLGEEIASRSAVRSETFVVQNVPRATFVAQEEAPQMTASAAEAPRMSEEGKSDAERRLEAELEASRQRCLELEARVLQLQEAEEDEADPRAEQLLANMENPTGDSVMRDQLEDIQYQLKATQKRLKAANETIKRQAQRIALLENAE